MQEQGASPAAKIHNVILESRKNLSISGVLDVDSYDEQSVVMLTEQGELTVKGLDLHINRIDVASGDLQLEGEIFALSYTDGPSKRSGLLSRLFR